MTRKPVGPVAILLLTVTALGGSTAWWLGQPWRAVSVMAFVLVAPGLAFMGWIREPGQVLPRAVLTVALSVALATLASEALAIVRAWWAPALVLILAGAALSAAAWPRQQAGETP